MDRKKFERESGDLDSGFYVNVQFSLAPDKLEGAAQQADRSTTLSTVSFI